jgi:hypothetical protein
MTNEHRDAIIQKIMKCLELGSEKNPNLNERKLAQEKAAKLMADYEISFVDLKKGQKKEEVVIEVRMEAMYRRDYGWEGMLANEIATAFDGRCLLQQNWKGEYTIIFLGHKADMDIVTFFFTFLRRTVDQMSKIFLRRRIDEGLRHDKRAEQEAYRRGVVITIGERMQEIYQQKMNMMSADTTALVIYKKDLVQQFQDEKYPKTKQGAAMKGGSYASYSAGRNDGKGINLNRPISHSGKNHAQIQ